MKKVSFLDRSCFCELCGTIFLVTPSGYLLCSMPCAGAVLISCDDGRRGLVASHWRRVVREVALERAREDAVRDFAAGLCCLPKNKGLRAAYVRAYGLGEQIKGGGGE
jgi:hypothetical protein